MNSKKHIFGFIFILFIAFNLKAQETVIVGGELMYPNKNIVENAVNSADHTTLVAAVKAGDLVETLMSEGPFTVFAPTNDAFENLPEGTVSELLKPANKSQLVSVLTYHVIPGTYDFKTLTKQIKKGGGKAELTTVQGSKLTFMMNGTNNIMVMDANGNRANITLSDVYQSNGVINVIDGVLLP